MQIPTSILAFALTLLGLAGVAQVRAQDTATPDLSSVVSSLGGPSAVTSEIGSLVSSVVSSLTASAANTTEVYPTTSAPVLTTTEEESTATSTDTSPATETAVPTGAAAALPVIQGGLAAAGLLAVLV